ncbi:MAG: hypothetical protein IJZ54_04195 [Clostridia bacterium]|nr:hypothetical protein [Clostridia bacterium]
MSDEIKDIQQKDNMIDSIIEETRYLSEKEKMEMEALKLNKVKRNRGTAGVEEIYSNKSKEVRYTNQNPLDIADDETEENTQEITEQEAEEEEKARQSQEKAEEEVAVTLTPEYEEGTKISEDIVENVENFNVKPVKIKDIDTIDIDLDAEEGEAEDSEKSEKSEVKAEAEAEVKPEDEAQAEAEPQKEESEFEKLFGKAKPVSSAQKVVSRVPVYQHESKVDKVHVRAGKFSSVVENEYKKYIASPNPVISQRMTPQEEKVEEEEKTPKKVADGIFGRIVGFFSSNEEDNDDFRDKTVQIEDYKSRQDSSSIMQEINLNIRKMFLNSLFMGVITALLLALSIVTVIMGSSFTDVVSIVISFVSTLLLLLGCWICRVALLNGLAPLKKFKGNSDTGVSVASIAGVIQGIVSIFTATSFAKGNMHLYAVIVSVLLLANCLGKLFMVLRVKDNFKFITQKAPTYSGKIYVNEDIAKKLMSGTLGKPIVAYQVESDFLSDYLKISYSPDPSEDMSGKVAPVAILCSLFVSILYGILTRGDIFGAVSALALMCAVSVPVANLLAVNLPMRKLCSDTLAKNAMIAGYPSVRQFCDTKAVIVEAGDLYPTGSITLNGVKAFDNYRIEESFLACAAVLREAKSPLASVFDNVVDNHGGKLPSVESVMYEDKLGLVGWVSGERLLVGSAELLEKFGVEAPALSGEEQYMKEGRQKTYFAKGSKAVAMFVTTYSSTLRIAEELQRAEANGISLLVRTSDPNITNEKIAEDFGIFFRSVKVLSTGLGNVCREISSQKEDTSRAYLATRGSFLPFLRAISGCVRMKSNISLSVVIQLIGLILGVLLSAAIVLCSGVHNLSALKILLYILFWGIAAVVAPLIQKS